MEKELEGFEEGPKVKIHFHLLRATVKKKYQMGKRPVMMVYVDTGLKNHFHSRETIYQNE